MALNNKIIGAAGEHYAMYELLRRGFIAALVPEGVPNIDILVSDTDGSQLAAIQVKTASAKRSGWPMGVRQESVLSANLFYCFLMPEAEGMTAFKSWIIPSQVVSAHLRDTHSTWLEGCPKRGKTRKDSARRAMHHNFSELEQYKSGWLDEYENNWESIT